MQELWQLFIIFCRIGGFTFGGGYAMLPIIQREIVEKRNWASDQEILDYYAIGQTTPGIIAVNTATFIGYKRKGIIGAITATAGMVFPSMVIITLIAAFFTQFKDYQIVKHAFAGIRVAVVVLILNAVIKMWKNSVKDWIGIVIFCATFVIAAFTQISPIIVIIISAIAGIFINIRKVEAK
ncbi:MAG TPA: chromate transporter [Clostridiaceae bacterium]|nr:chromate transporter [Clostridiaceae bacterium]